jgi:hypothetical protein
MLDVASRLRRLLLEASAASVLEDELQSASSVAGFTLSSVVS